MYKLWCVIVTAHLWGYKQTKSEGIAEYGQLCYNYKYPPDWSFSYNSVVIIVNTSVHVHMFTKIHGEGIMSHIFHCSYVALWEGKYHTCCIGKTILGGIYFTVKQILVQTHYHMLFQKISLHVCMHICKSSCVKYCALIVCCLLEHVLKKDCVHHFMYCCYVHAHSWQPTCMLFFLLLIDQHVWLCVDSAHKSVVYDRRCVILWLVVWSQGMNSYW